MQVPELFFRILIFGTKHGVSSDFFLVTPHGHAHENSPKHLRLQGALSFPRMQGRGQGLGLAHARRSAAASTLIMMPNYRGRPSY